jgi:putative ABC transport system permease protein
MAFFCSGAYVNMDFGFLDMMKIKIVEGRDLSPEFSRHGEQYVDE